MKALITNLLLLTCLLQLCACPAGDSGDKSSKDVGISTDEVVPDSTASDDNEDPAPNSFNLHLGQPFRLSTDLRELDISVPVDIYSVEIVSGSKVEKLLVEILDPNELKSGQFDWLPLSAGKFRMAQNGTQLGNDITVSEWPVGSMEDETPPYVAINAGKIPDDMALDTGLPLHAWYHVPAGFPADAWVGLFRADMDTGVDALPADAIESFTISGELGKRTFFPNEAGLYVVRMYASEQIANSQVCQSQQIKVVKGD